MIHERGAFIRAWRLLWKRLDRARPSPSPSSPGDPDRGYLLGGCRSAESGSTGVLDGLTRPQHGRSMRATSAMRVGEIRRGSGGDRNAGERRYDPTADFRADADVQSNWDNFNVPPAARTCCSTPRARVSSPTSGSRSWAGAPELGAPGVGRPPGAVAAYVLGWQPTTGGGSSRRRLFRQLLRPPERGGEPAGRRRGRRLLQCLLAHALPQVGADRIENQSAKPLSLLYFNIDWIKLDSLPATHRTSTRSIARSIPSGRGRTTSSSKPPARATMWARSWGCARAARPGSAKATRRSTSTAR